MPARDMFHNAVKAALQKEGWTITHDPLPIPYGGIDLYIDLGAERMLAAERDGERIVDPRICTVLERGSCKIAV